MEQRLQKILAQHGIASRRRAEALIQEGRVKVNGEVAQLGQQADLTVDQLEVDDVSIVPSQRPQPAYLLLNKPLSIVCTCDDPWNRRTVLDLLPRELQGAQGIHPVGRLDAQSTGALLLTNDGSLTHGLTHPRHHVSKIYHVRVQGKPSKAAIQRWRRGLLLSGKPTLPAEVDVLRCDVEGQTRLRVVLQEGRNRQIRRVAEQLGHPVIALHRIAIGPIQLQRLKEGQCRLLNPAEVDKLKSCARLPVTELSRV